MLLRADRILIQLACLRRFFWLSDILSHLSSFKLTHWSVWRRLSSLFAGLIAARCFFQHPGNIRSLRHTEYSFAKAVGSSRLLFCLVYLHKWGDIVFCLMDIGRFPAILFWEKGFYCVLHKVLLSWLCCSRTLDFGHMPMPICHYPLLRTTQNGYIVISICGWVSLILEGASCVHPIKLVGWT